MAAESQMPEGGHHPHLPQTPNTPSSWHLFLPIFDSGARLATRDDQGRDVPHLCRLNHRPHQSPPPQSNRRCCLKHGLSGNTGSKTSCAQIISQYVLLNSAEFRRKLFVNPQYCIEVFLCCSVINVTWFSLFNVTPLSIWYFRIRTKHKIELHGNKKRISCYMFRIRLLPRRKSRKTLHVKIRAKHKIKLYSNKKRISCYIFSIRLLQEGRRSYKTTKLQKKIFVIYV